MLHGAVLSYAILSIYVSFHVILGPFLCNPQSTHMPICGAGTTSKHIVALIRSGLHTLRCVSPRHECTPAYKKPYKGGHYTLRGQNQHRCCSAGLRPDQHGQTSYRGSSLNLWRKYINARWHEDGPIYSPFARHTPSQGHLCGGVGQP